MAPIEPLRFTPAVPNSANELAVRTAAQVDTIREERQAAAVEAAEVTPRALTFTQGEVFGLMKLVMRDRGYGYDPSGWGRDLDRTALLMLPEGALSSPRQRLLRRYLLANPARLIQYADRDVLRGSSQTGNANLEFFTIPLNRTVSSDAERFRIEQEQTFNLAERTQQQRGASGADLFAQQSPFRVDSASPLQQQRATENAQLRGNQPLTPDQIARAGLVPPAASSAAAQRNNAANTNPQQAAPYILSPAQQQFALAQLSQQQDTNDEQIAFYLLAFFRSLNPHAMAMQMYQQVIRAMGPISPYYPDANRPQVSRPRYRPRVQAVHFKMDI